jgi:hypothetical protein
MPSERRVRFHKVLRGADSSCVWLEKATSADRVGCARSAATSFFLLSSWPQGRLPFVTEGINNCFVRMYSGLGRCMSLPRPHLGLRSCTRRSWSLRRPPFSRGQKGGPLAHKCRPATHRKLGALIVPLTPGALLRKTNLARTFDRRMGFGFGVNGHLSVKQGVSFSKRSLSIASEILFPCGRRLALSAAI